LRSPFSQKLPPSTVVPYGGVEHSIRAMLEAVRGPRGNLAPAVRFAAEGIVRFVAPKDYLSEVAAVRYWVNARIPYLRDPATVEWLRDPVALLEDINHHGIVRADCDEIAMLTASLWMSLGNKADFATVGFSPGPPATHVLARCFIPKIDVPIICDPVAGTREPKMAQSVRHFKLYPIDQD